MSTFFIIMAVSFLIGIRLLKKVQSQIPGQENVAEDEGTAARNVRPAYESLFDFEKETHSSTFADEVRKAGYTTYEMNDVPARKSVRPQSVHPAAPRTAPKEEPVKTANFDLRQAVIYQTILTNKYLSNDHSYEIN